MIAAGNNIGVGRYIRRKKNGRSSNLCWLEFNRQEIPQPSEKKIVIPNIFCNFATVSGERVGSRNMV